MDGFVMRLKYKTDEIGSDWELLGYKFKGPLILSRDPVNDEEVATKDYVDNRFSSIDVSTLKGILPVSMLPSFQGAVTNNEGSSVFTWVKTGVVPGIYTKVRLGGDGRVQEGSDITTDDLPKVPFSKFKNKPNTLSGYGIDSALTTSGGLVSSDFRISSTPTDPLHLISRSYVSGLIGETVVLEPGTVIMNSSEHSIPGYIRLNGAMVDKADYPDLYRVIGDKYWEDNVFLGYGKPWEQGYGLSSATVIGLSKTGTSKINFTYNRDQYSFSVGSRSYILGGDTVSGYSTVYFTTGRGTFIDISMDRINPISINRGSRINTPTDRDYVLTAGMSQPNYYTQTGAYYTVGATFASLGPYSNVVFPAGTEFRWTNGLSGTRSWSGRVLFDDGDWPTGATGTITGSSNGNCTYSLLGYSTSYSHYSTPIGYTTTTQFTTFTTEYSDGTETSYTGNKYSSSYTLNDIEQTIPNTFDKRVLSFTPLTNTSSSRCRVRYANLPKAKIDGVIPDTTVSFPEVLAIGNSIYVLGGETPNGVPTDMVQRAQLNLDGDDYTAWSVHNPLPVALSGTRGFLFGNKVFLLGGRTVVGVSNTIYSATVNPDRSLSNWNVEGELPVGLFGHSLIMVGTKVYIIGGMTINGASNKIYSTTIRSSGHLGLFEEYMELSSGPGISSIVVTSGSFLLLSKTHEITGAVSRSGLFNINIELEERTDVEAAGLVCFGNGGVIRSRRLSDGTNQQYGSSVKMVINPEHYDGDQGVNFMDESKFYLPDISSGGTEYEYYVKVI